MLGLIGNLSLGETLVIVVLAVLVFGRRLPEMAARGALALKRFRRTVDDLRRESGFDEELRRVQSSLRDVRREVDRPLRTPPEPRTSRRPSLHAPPREPSPQRPTEPRPPSADGGEPSEPEPRPPGGAPRPPLE